MTSPPRPNPAAVPAMTDVVITNLDASIDRERAAALQAAPFTQARHAAWHFNGRVWWDSDRQCWVEQVWRLHRVVDVIDAATIDDLRQIVNDRHGWT